MLDLTARELLTHLFHHAIDRVDGRRVVHDWCAHNTQNNNQTFKYCVAIGKAAPAMLQGALDSINNLQECLLICPRASAPRVFKRHKKVSKVESSHPVPDQKSLDAGKVLLSFLAKLPDNEPILFLISGGASSLVEVLKDGVSLAQLQDINNYLLGSGKSIEQINYWRKQYSKIKGGGLLDCINPLSCTQLLISDVQNDEIAVIGSGLLLNSDNTDSDDDDVLQQSLNITDASKSSNREQVATHIVANQQMALEAIHNEAAHYELDTFLHEEFISGDAREQGEKLSEWLLEAPCGLHIWGGETTVSLPDNPGMGGRNQHFLLSCVSTIQDKNISILSAGTDGIDGNTSCAGGMVTGFTGKTLSQMGFDINQELDKANSGNVLMASDCLYKTGRTNTNVMDLIIAYKSSDELVTR